MSRSQRMEASVFAKLVFTILALGACCCTLLFLRHDRIVAASEMTKVQTRVRQQDEELWKLRVKIAEKVSPQHVTLMAQTIGPLHPLRPESPMLASNDAGAPPQPTDLSRREVVTVPPPNASDAGKARKDDRKGKKTKPFTPGRLGDSRYAHKETGSAR